MGHRGYPAEFRRKVLDLGQAGRSVADVARDLGISTETIYVWRRQDRIGHLPYTVTVSDAEVDKVSREEEVTLSGFSEHHKQRIVLREDNLPDYQVETLLHEILHQCLRVCGVHPGADAKAGATDIEEHTVTSMSGPLLAVLRNTPDLVAYLTSGMEGSAS